MHSTASARIWLARARAATVTAMARRRVVLSFCAVWFALAASAGWARGGVGSRRSHRVASGESLWKIARAYRCTVDDLRRANRLGGDVVRPGQRLRIPACDEGEERRPARAALLLQRRASSEADPVDPPETDAGHAEDAVEPGAAGEGVDEETARDGPGVDGADAFAQGEAGQGGEAAPGRRDARESWANAERAGPGARRAARAGADAAAYRARRRPRSGDAVRDLEEAVRELDAEVRRHERVSSLVRDRGEDRVRVESVPVEDGARDRVSLTGERMRDRLPDAGETALDQGRSARRGRVAVAVPLRGQSFGRPQRGYLVSGVHMPADPAAYYLRRPERAWGTTHTVRTLVRAIQQVRKRYPRVPPLSIGDLSLRHGGRISIHGSHQSGRDADIGFYFRKSPRGYPRAFAVATADNLDFGPTWALLGALCKTAGRPLGVERIFMTYSTQAMLYNLALRHRIPRAQLDEWFQYPHGRRADHGVIRHEPGHEEHFHVRFRCAPTDPECE